MSCQTNCERVAILSEELKAKIDYQLQKYPADQKQSAVKSALTYAQEENGGWLSQPIINAVADYLEMPRIAAYEVATFYTMYDLDPVGRYKINVCTNISCMLCGSHKIMEHLENRLGIKRGETTSDGKFTLREVECLAACVNAPMMQINKETYEHLTTEKLDEIINKYEAAPLTDAVVAKLVGEE